MVEQKMYEDAEKSAHKKIIEFTEQPEIQAQISEAFFIWQNNPNMITDYSSDEDLDDETFTKFFDWFIHDFRLLDSQKRILDKFLEEHEESLTGIEKEIINVWQKSTNSFFEVLDVTPGDGCSIRDIFTENTIYVSDVNASKKLSKSDMISARPISSNKKNYFSGLISAFPKVLKQKVLDHFTIEFEDYRNQHGRGKSIDEFLKDWGYQLIHNIEDLLNHPQYLNPDGEEFVIAKAYYNLKDRKEIVSYLRSSKQFREVTGGNTDLSVFIFREDNSTFIEVDKSSVTLECNSEKKLFELKDKLEGIFEELLVHSEDLVKPLDSFVNKNQNDEVIDLEVDSLDSYYDDWIKMPLDRLGGLSPVQAMKDEDKKAELEKVLFEMEKLFEDAKKHGEPYYDVKRIREKLRSLQ